MNTAEKIKKPIVKELEEFKTLFHNALSDKDGLLGDALLHISNRGGKMMRPILVMLIAKNFGKINMVTQNGALGLELLHTASLVHDDVVDESVERRGQASMNAIYDNRVSILVGDYILSTALFHVAKTRHTEIVSLLADLGRTLSDGELKQLSNISKKDISEEEYYRIIQISLAIFHIIRICSLCIYSLRISANCWLKMPSTRDRSSRSSCLSSAISVATSRLVAYSFASASGSGGLRGGLSARCISLKPRTIEIT